MELTYEDIQRRFRQYGNDALKNICRSLAHGHSERSDELYEAASDELMDRIGEPEFVEFMSEV